MLSHVLSGDRTLFLTKNMYALYKVIISAKTIDISGFKMIYNTAGGSCKRHQLCSTSEALQLTLSDLPSLLCAPISVRRALSSLIFLALSNLMDLATP
jgi:hypothetical protein